MRPRGEQGRIYEKIDNPTSSPEEPSAPAPSSPGNASMFPKATATLEIQVTHADGSVDTYEAPAQIEEANLNG